MARNRIGTPKRLTTPRAAAVAGVLFALLFGTALILIRAALPEGAEPCGALTAGVRRDPRDAGPEVPARSAASQRTATAILAVGANGGVLAEGERARAYAQRWSWREIGPVWDRLLG